MHHERIDSSQSRPSRGGAARAVALAVAAILVSAFAGLPAGRQAQVAQPLPTSGVRAPASMAATTLDGATPAAARSPGGLGWYSTNWAGYAVGGGRYSSVGAQWTVPNLSTGGRSGFSALWVGIDGYTSPALIQAGTEADFYNGAAHYSAWWEILPAPAVTIRTLSVRPGDRMSVMITRVSAGRWRIVVRDARSGSYATSRAYAGPATSAEWIEETPIVGGRTTPLAAHATVVFDNATLNGRSPNLAPRDAGAMIRRGVVVDTPSAPDADGNGFALAQRATPPPRPRS